MKIAVCMSGSLRQFKTCYPNLKDSLFGLEGIEYDFFLSSWDSKIRHQKVDFKDEGSFQEALDLYKPKKYNYEIYDKEKRKEIYELSGLSKVDMKQFRGSKMNNYIGQLYNIYQANKLKSEYEKEKGFKYDLSMRMRYDGWVFRGALTKEAIININEGEIAVTSLGWVTNTNKNTNKPWRQGPDDKFAIGKSHEMDIYSSMFVNFEDILMLNIDKYQSFPLIHSCIGEICKRNNIKITQVELGVSVYYKIVGYDRNMESDQIKNIVGAIDAEKIHLRKK